MFQSDLFPAGEQLPSMPFAYAIGTRVAALLASGRHLTRTDISGLFADETGVREGTPRTIDTVCGSTARLGRVETEPNDIPATLCQFEHDPAADPIGPARYNHRLRFRHFATFLRIHHNPQYI